MSEYLDRAEAATELSRLLGIPVTKRTLEKLAERGEGPEYLIVLRKAAYPRDGLHAWAKSAGHNEVVALLEETLAEEKKTDALLNQLANQSINPQAFRQAA